jgi:hypothetical protein
MKTLIAAAVVALGCASAHAQTAPAQNAPIEATTGAGDKVRLFPDGRWEFVDPKKRAEMPAAAQPAAAGTQACPPGSQGGLFGIGRCIPPGDPQYNRGSLGKK